MGLSESEPDSLALVEDANNDVSAYISPPVSPTKRDFIKVVATKANHTSNGTGRFAFESHFNTPLERRPQIGSSSLQDWTTPNDTETWTWDKIDGLFLVDTNQYNGAHGVLSFTAGSQLPQQVEESASLTVVKTPRNTLAVEDRKRFFIETPTYTLKVKLENWVSSVYQELDASRSDEECWLHPCPPLPKPNGRAYGTIHRRFSWRNGRSHTLTVNFGLAALAVKGSMTEDQKEGFIGKSWHLSHLCGNWTCCNSHHHTVEPRSTNVKRNACFRRDHGCEHQPPCMKHLKRRDLQPVREVSNEEVSVQGVPGLWAPVGI